MNNSSLRRARAYLGAQEIQAPAVSAQVDEGAARAQQAQLVGITAGR